MHNDSDQPGRRRAQSLVEYALVLVLLAGVVVVVLQSLAGSSSAQFGTAGNALDDSTTDPLLPCIYISSINLSVRQRGHSPSIRGDVYVYDEDARGVRRVTVTVAFSVNGQVVANQSASTNGGGRARLVYRSDELGSGDIVGLDVSSIARAGYRHDWIRDLETSKQIVVP